MTQIEQSKGFLSLVDTDHGLVDRSIFSAQAIYEMELERIFARTWNFMAHDSQIPKPGDFFLTYIGEDRIIVVRDKEMQPQVLLNTCRHRGNAVCRAEYGHATSFMCTYHGWTYDLQGSLIGVPGFKELYHEDIDRSEWGLIKAPHVDSYKGFIFANLDPEAPGLDEWLGEVGHMALDVLTTGKGDMTILPGIQKFQINTNWKFAADNIWDWYHAGLTHASAIMSRGPQRGNRPSSGNTVSIKLNQLIVMGEYGHAAGGPGGELPPGMVGHGILETPESRAALGPVGMQLRGSSQIFPNLWVQYQTGLTLRLPKGPAKTEIWRFCFTQSTMTDEDTRNLVYSFNTGQGPSGMFEQDDGENWAQSTSGTFGTVSRKFPLNYAMNLGHGEVIEDELGPPRIQALQNEHAQLWFYKSWAEWMEFDSWQSLKANHSKVPRGIV